jgi:tetratricopeptide (TPR) repeat protein
MGLARAWIQVVPAARAERARRAASRALLAAVLACAVPALAGAITAGAAAGEAAGTPADAAAGRAGVDVSDLPGAARRALFRARGFLQDNQPERAVEVLETYLRENNGADYPVLRSYLAAGLAQVGRTEDALAEYQRLVQADPGDVQSWLRIGELAYGLQRYADAANAFLAGQRLLPADPPGAAAGALYYAAISLLAGGDASRALPILEDLVSGRRGRPEFDWYRSLIAAQLDQGRSADAEAAIASMLQQFGDDPRAWLLVAQCAAQQGDYRHAAGAFTLVGYLRPLSANERIQLGDLYVAAGVPLEAAGLYEGALADSSSATMIERLASAYLAAHRPDAAAAVLEQALHKSPAGRLWLMLGEIRYTQGRYAAAYETLRQAATLLPGRGRVQLLLGYCAVELGRREEAVRHLEAAAADSAEGTRARDLLRKLAEDERRGDRGLSRP